MFNVELNEGLEHSHETGLDADPFDPYCDHFLVEHATGGEVVGTYRLQTGSSAARCTQIASLQSPLTDGLAATRLNLEAAVGWTVIAPAPAGTERNENAGRVTHRSRPKIRFVMESFRALKSSSPTILAAGRLPETVTGPDLNSGRRRPDSSTQLLDSE